MKRSEDLLDDLRDRVAALRSRASQLAGFSGAVITLVGANSGSVLSGLHGAARSSAGIALLLATILLVSAFFIALRGTNLPQPASEISLAEIAEYTSGRLIHEPELWRIHVRTMRGLEVLIDFTSRQEDKAAVSIAQAGWLFLLGLVSVAVSLCILIVVEAF